MYILSLNYLLNKANQGNEAISFLTGEYKLLVQSNDI